jgi:hypothetical protein
MDTSTTGSQSLLPGVNVLLEGPTGTGKTHSIGTLVDSGLETYYLALESGLESLLGYWTDKGKVIPENLHWHHISHADSNFDVMLKAAQTINMSTNEALAKMQDMDKARYNSFVKILQALNNFEDQRTSTKHGSPQVWGPDKCLVIDALTGLNVAAMSLVSGGKPIKSLVDWGVAMDQIEKLIRMLTEGCRCHFVLLAHIEREIDQVLGGQKITVGTLGQKLAGKIPPLFSDVILAERRGVEFMWSTANPNADLKTRNLPISEKLSPNFQQIITKWQSRGGRFTPTIQK